MSFKIQRDASEIKKSRVAILLMVPRMFSRSWCQWIRQNLIYGSYDESGSAVESKHLMKFLPTIEKLLKSEGEDREDASKFVVLLLIMDNIYVS
ncbi:hypothetical protein Bca101_065846 [Brassica carinata]